MLLWREKPIPAGRILSQAGFNSTLYLLRGLKLVFRFGFARKREVRLY